MDRFRQLYDVLLDSGDLKKLVPQMKGNWEEDKNKFVRFQRELEELANATDLDIE